MTMERKYNSAEWAAAKRVGLNTKQPNDYQSIIAGGPKYLPGGPMIYATGNYHPAHARKMAEDWSIVADAMKREWGSASHQMEHETTAELIERARTLAPHTEDGPIIRELADALEREAGK
ncbi:hypothetical protein [Arthrobacter roseus]|uniref:hypothetical protein n=1 Tax=Arthrobacter roseus TaxID=136274 RepID=UPI001966C133|nr:hypothetical protein [Arthrobacter roseus]MBM7847480.1 hypothetical protein [Arthrobacter roseus]